MNEVAKSVLEGVSFAGDVNTPDETLLENIRHSIRLGHPQVRPQPLNMERICLVGGGPSLEDTFDELRQLHFEGAKVVALNGAAEWLLARNIRPSAHVVLDARPENARFLKQDIPQCKYLLASQCHPNTWAAVAGRDVRIWHAIGPDEPTEKLLNDFYAGQWMSIGHGPIGTTTVALRSVALWRTMGFVRMDLFGVDSCFMDGKHHAYAQSENDRDKPFSVTVSLTGQPEVKKTFRCAPWHLKQLEDFLQMIRATGDQYVLNVHGNGLLAYALQVNAELDIAATGSIHEE